LEKKWFAREKFDPRFSEAAFEDIDIGLRLEKKGLKIIYDPLSVVRHSHFYDEPEFYRRMRNVGRAFTVLADKYQEDKKDLRRLKIKYAPFLFFPGLKVFSFLARIASACWMVKRLNKKLFWFLNICYYYSLGIIQGNKLRK
jgi:GT2 family glycosyltransferase